MAGTGVGVKSCGTGSGNHALGRWGTARACEGPSVTGGAGGGRVSEKEMFRQTTFLLGANLSACDRKGRLRLNKYTDLEERPLLSTVHPLRAERGSAEQRPRPAGCRQEAAPPVCEGERAAPRAPHGEDSAPPRRRRPGSVPAGFLS